MRVIFMGTPDFSVPALEALVAAGHEVVAVYSQPPRPAGRGKALRPSPVQARAEALGLAVHHPISLRGAAPSIAQHQADIAVVVAYGLILPQAVLDAPRLGCLNIHASLLPRWRGAAPIHRAIMAGDAQTGVCIMQMEAGLDTGPVLMRQALDIGAIETTGALQDRLSALGAGLIVQALDQIETLRPAVQPQEGVTYAAKIDKAEAALDWAKSAPEIACQINGLSPFPGAFVVRGGARLKLLQARAVAGTGTPGQIIGPGLIACASGAIELIRVQPAGKPAMDAEAWWRGAGLAMGQNLEDV